MSWDDELERRHYEREQEKKEQRGDFLPWDMDRVTFDLKETFYLRILRPPGGRVYSKAFHWPKGMRQIICTRDHPAFQVKNDDGTTTGRCVCCHYFDNKSRGRRKTDDVLEVIDFRYFHLDGDDIVRCIHDEPDGEIRNVRCHLCNSPDEKVAKRYFGGHKVMELREYQYNQVWAAHEKLSDYCISVVGEDEDGPVICGKKNYLLLFLCRNCDEVLMDEQTVKSLAPVAQDKFKRARQTCPNCNAKDFPYPLYACDSDKGRTPTPLEIKDGVEPEPGEHWCIRGSMFDKVLEVSIAGEVKSIKGQGDITLKNLNVSTGEAWSPVGLDLSYFGFSDEEIEEMCKPMDLVHRYRPSYKLKPEDFRNEEEWVMAVLDEQAEVIGKANPFRPGGGSSGRSFGPSHGQRRSFRA